MRPDASKVVGRVERAAEEISLEELIDADHQHEVGAATSLDSYPPHELPNRDLAPRNLEGICVNPLRDEPTALEVGAVKRFGLVGLIGCALWAAVVRGWKSLVR